jgi:hypothetical protein
MNLFINALLLIASLAIIGIAAAGVALDGRV